MKEKSEKTLEVAQHLLNVEHFTQSVHCSYYSVLQRMKYYLANVKDNPISYQEQDEKKDGDSHEYLLLEVKNKWDKVPPRNKRAFSEEFRNLKKARVDADYTDKVMTAEEGADWKQRANGLLSNLDTYFRNLM